jgi:hypothetical protein
MKTSEEWLINLLLYITSFKCGREGWKWFNEKGNRDF